jgi:hypothetical protein
VSRLKQSGPKGGVSGEQQAAQYTSPHGQTPHGQGGYYPPPENGYYPPQNGAMQVGYGGAGGQPPPQVPMQYNGFAEAQPEPPSMKSQIFTNIMYGFGFCLIFTGVMSLFGGRNRKVVVQHDGNQPLTTEQMIQSTPMHDNRMFAHQHVYNGQPLTPQSQTSQSQQSYLRSPQPQHSQQSQQPYSGPYLPPPVALPQYQTTNSDHHHHHHHQQQQQQQH